MIELILILCIATVAYAYIGYPILLGILNSFLGRPVIKADIEPRVSIIIAAYNEEKDIAQKIENALALDYPSQKLEIIVASDCSTDRTDEIARGFQDRGIVVYRSQQRLGKTAAQNRAISVSTGQIIVFSDATTVYDSSSIRKLVQAFADTSVGCVAGTLVYTNESGSSTGKGCRSYWSYENVLKRNESRLSSLIGVSGCMYAVRRSSYMQLTHSLSSDFVIAAEMKLLSLRTVHEPEAICYEQTNRRVKDEFKMRVRVIEQTITALVFYRRLLNPFRHGLFAIQMISHKALRYGVPWVLVIAFAANIALASSSLVFLVMLVIQTGFYGAAALGLAFQRLGLTQRVLSLPAYFVLTNAAAAQGLIKYLRGESHVVWDPIRNGTEENAILGG
jgi:cellulose synthase/poly-beta-1,6-N-acetylglucosamine synthase-like glycosyltransferase